MRRRTYEQVETAKDRAERFLRDVLEDDDRADEVMEESVEEYAERKGIEIVKLRDNPRKVRNMSTRAELEEALTEVNDKLDQVFSIADEAGTTKAEMADALQEIVDLTTRATDDNEEEEEDEDEEAA